MTTELLTEQDAKTIVDKWVNDVSELARQIKTWLEEDPAKPEIHSQKQTCTEPPLPQYELVLAEAWYKGDERVGLIMPVRNYPGHGQITLIHWPTLRRVRVIQNLGSQPWTIYTDSGIPLRQEWNRSNFLQLVEDLRADN